MFNLILTITVYSIVSTAAVLILALIIFDRERWLFSFPGGAGSHFSSGMPDICLIHRDEEADHYFLFVKSLKKHCS